MTCRSRRQSPKAARGFSLVAAIYVLVVLAALGVAIAVIGEAQRLTFIAALQGARAFHAAQSGIEWGIHQALTNTVPTCGAVPATPTTNNLTLTDVGLGGFQVAVVCTFTQHQEGPATYNVYALTATAVTGIFGAPDYAQRVVVATVTNAPPP